MTPRLASLRWIRQLACRAYWTALDQASGPVHLNIPLREPLVADGPLPDDALAARPGGVPWVRRPAAPRPPSALERAPVGRRGVIVAGRLEHGRAVANDSPGAAVAHAVVSLADRARWPILADPLSGARSAANAIATYDLMLQLDAVR